MSGLEKMIDRIQQDAKLKSDEVIRIATEEAQRTVSQAAETEKQRQQKASEKLEHELKEYKSRALSARELKTRRALLEAKQEIIADMIGRVCETMRDAEDQTYFATLEKMFAMYVHAETGSMYLGEKDLARVPAGFEEKLQTLAQEKGGKITLMKTPGTIPDGFLLVYDGIEENCTFEALVDANRNKLSDRINTLLWRDQDAG